MKAFLFLALSAISLSAQAQLNTCIENGKRVIRQSPCNAAAATQPPVASVVAPREAVFDKPVTTLTPVFNQVVLFTLPAGWSPAHKDEKANSFIMEFLPKDQTVQSWREMITVQAYRDFAQKSDASPATYLAMAGDGMEKTCPGQAVVQPLGDTRVDSHEAATAIMGCASLQGRGEVAWYLAIKTRNDLIVIQRALRGAPFRRDRAPLTAANAQQYIASFQPLKVCDRSEPPAKCLEPRGR